MAEPDVQLTRVHEQSGSSIEIFQIINERTSALTVSLEEDETFLTAASTIASASELSEIGYTRGGSSNYESALQFDI